MENIIRNFPRDYRRGASTMLENGWRAKPTKKGFLFLAPDGVGSVMLHKTPSDCRGAANFRAEVRRLSGLTLSF